MYSFLCIHRLSAPAVFYLKRPRCFLDCDCVSVHIRLICVLKIFKVAYVELLRPPPWKDYDDSQPV